MNLKQLCKLAIFKWKPKQNPFVTGQKAIAKKTPKILENNT